MLPRIFVEKAQITDADPRLRMLWVSSPNVAKWARAHKKQQIGLRKWLKRVGLLLSPFQQQAKEKKQQGREKKKQKKRRKKGNFFFQIFFKYLGVILHRNKLGFSLSRFSGCFIDSTERCNIHIVDLSAVWISSNPGVYIEIVFSNRINIIDLQFS